MDSIETLNPAANNPPASRPDEFNETAPVQPGTEVEPNAPAESPTAPEPSPPIPDAPTDQGVDRNLNDRVESEVEAQEDEDAQAQTIADDAIRGRNHDQLQMEESEHGGTSNPAQIIPDDGQDVVDHMQQMERSGRIDMGAFDGERNDDDEPQMYGEGGMEPGDLDEHGSERKYADYGGTV